MRLNSDRPRRALAFSNSLTGACSIDTIVALGSLLIALLLSGCTTPPAPPVVAGTVPEIADDEGLLIIDVDTDYPIKWIQAPGAVEVEKLPKGTHTWIIRAKAGNYRWNKIELEPASSWPYIGSRGTFADEEFEFEVVAGALNYPGEIIVRSNPVHRSAGRGIWVRNRDHSAMAIRALRKSHASVLDAFPIRYSGSSGDGFLEHYVERRQHSSPDSPTTSGAIDVNAPSGGSSAAAIFSSDGIQRVRVSPDGQWAIAHAQKVRDQGVMVQRLGTNQVITAISSKSPVVDLVWIGPNSFLTSLARNTGLASVICTIGLAGNEIIVQKTWIDAPGTFVHPLPLDEGHVIWKFVWDGESSVNKVSIEDLTDFRTLHGGYSKGLRAGDSLARIRGTWVNWVVDRHGMPRAAIRREDDGFALLARGGLGGGFVEIYFFADSEEERQVWPVGLSVDGKQLIAQAYGGHDTLGLVEFDLARRELGKTLFRLDGVDVSGAVGDFISGELVAAVYTEGGATRYHYFDSVTSKQLERLGGNLAKEDVVVVSRSADQRSLVLLSADSTNPGYFIFFDARTGLSFPIGQRRSRVDRDRLVETETLHLESKDGTDVEAFLTLPARGLDTETRGAPLIVIPHGGPIGIQDRKTFDPLIQYLASWGFASLQVNYRGSSGYGREFEDAGKKQWARGIEDDIDAAVEVTMARPEVDSSRICMLGGSYGGFSSLASILRHPDRYRCAVTINGVTDIPLMFDSSDFADSDERLEGFSKVVGKLEENRDQLIEVSPVYSVADMQVPVFVAFGTDDRRVDPDHAHRLLLMLETHDKAHDVLEIRGAAHSPSPREWIIFVRAARRFLTEHLFAPGDFVPDPKLKSSAFDILLEVKQ